MKPERQLATVLFTDIVASTERVAELGDARWRQLLEAHDSVVRREIQRHGGRVINTTGDGFVSLFSSPAAGLHCACAIRGDVHRMGLQLRAGLHTGEVENVTTGTGGMALHIGSRVMAAADPDEILVSSTVRELTEGSGYRFSDRGTRELKGVPGEWRLFAVESEPFADSLAAGAPAPPRRLSRAAVVPAVALALALVAAAFLLRRDSTPELGPRQALAEGAAPGLAVLPFDVRGPDLDVWREGMVDVLSTSLDGAGGLRAIDGRTVLARWRETVEEPGAPDLATSLEVARRAGARYALVGNIVSSGGDLRLNAEVYTVPDGATLGTVQVEGSPDSMFVLVDRLAIESLGTVLKGADTTAAPELARITTTSLPALKAFLEGESRLRRGDFAGSAEAYQRAIAADSTFAFALYRLAQTYGWSPQLEVRLTSEEYYEQAARHADRLNEREEVLVRGGLAFWRGDLEVVDQLREAVRKWPDEAEAWYELGEFYFHDGEQLLVSKKEAEEPFLQAVKLDPAFAPFQIHLINLSFMAFADSARARRYIADYERTAPQSPQLWASQLAYALIFGDSTSRTAAWAQVDTLPASLVNGLAANFLDHPRFARVTERVLESEPRPRGPTGWAMTANLVETKAHLGKLADALAYLGDGYGPPGLEAAGLYTIFDTGLPVSAQRLEEGLRLEDLHDVPADMAALRTFFAGAYAADKQRWEDHAEARRQLGGSAQSYLATGDTMGAKIARGLSRGLEGHGLWRRGDRRGALPLLLAAQREVTGQGPGELANATLRRWIGELLLDEGRPKEAVRWLESLDDNPLVAMQLGRTYEELGDYARARDTYAFLATTWEDADPELQPRVAEARAAAQRLTSAIRE